MGAWADGLAAETKKKQEVEKRIKEKRQQFHDKYLKFDIKEIISGEVQNHSYSPQELYFLCLRQIMLNQIEILNDGTTEQKNVSIGNARMLLKVLENFMLEM